jgi:tRNA nucleotidyltransferase (CCA-adding enzyme)
MSDYMFMLESHLNGDQSKAVAKIREAAEEANLNLFLTGGAMRDMMGGFPIRDLDFTVEGPTLKLARTVATVAGAEIVSIDDHRKSVELAAPGNVKFSFSMARTEKTGKPGSRPHVQQATIHEDLRGRDFTVNAIALSLGKASRGLLLDPTNGLGDLERKELRAASPYAFYDDPARMLRVFRFSVRLGFTIQERTLAQLRNAKEAELETKIPATGLNQELRQIAADPLSGEILKALEDEKLLHVFSSSLTGPKLNLPGFQRLQKARQALPFGFESNIDFYHLFLFLVLEKLTGKERGQLVKAAGIAPADCEAALKLESRAGKFERELAQAKLQRPSALYNLLSKVPPELLLFLLMRSGQRLVLDRIKNYLQKYLPTALEVTEQEVIELGAEPGTAKYDKLHRQLIAARLDARPKKVVVEEVPPPPPLPPNRRSASFAR